MQSHQAWRFTWLKSDLPNWWQHDLPGINLNQWVAKSSQVVRLCNQMEKKIVNITAKPTAKDELKRIPTIYISYLNLYSWIHLAIIFVMALYLESTSLHMARWYRIILCIKQFPKKKKKRINGWMKEIKSVIKKFPLFWGHGTTSMWHNQIPSIYLHAQLTEYERNTGLLKDTIK